MSFDSTLPFTNRAAYIPLPFLPPVRRYTEVMTRHLKKLEKTLYDDMLRHLKQTDQEVPWPWGEYLYYSRTVEGKVRL